MKGAPASASSQLQLVPEGLQLVATGSFLRESFEGKRQHASTPARIKLSAASWCLIPVSPGQDGELDSSFS